MGHNREEQHFRSYEAIAAQCSQLVQDQRVLEAQLAAPMSQLPALESSTEVLYQLLYNSSNQLQLSSPVSKHCCSTRPCWVQGGELTASQHTEGEEVGLSFALSQKLSSEAVAG